MAWKPPKQHDPEGDETEEQEPTEPNGHDLTEKRERQRQSREKTEGMWEQIRQELCETQRKQQYVPEPKRRRRNADGNR